MRVSLVSLIVGFIFLCLMPVAMYTRGFEPTVLFGILALFNVGMAVYNRIGEKI